MGKKAKKGGSKSKGKSKTDVADSIEQLLDERFYMGPNYAERRREACRKKIDAAFRMFERPSEGGAKGERTCDWRETKTIIRALDLNPTKEHIAIMLDEIEEPEPSAYIKYSRLEEMLLRVLMNQEYVPKNKKTSHENADGEPQFLSSLLVRDTEETIVRAFRVVDSANKGEIEAETFGNLMMQAGRPGEAFDREEVVDMVQAAADPDSALIRYEDSLYVDQLAND
eukprot:Rhum_TRINITY_DN11353_c2_g1::Rhum_TRINITY_DN11353_c2_g1_i1::g.44129::m.44129